MKKFIRILAALTVATLLVPFVWLAAAAMEELANSWTYRYRLTLSVLADGMMHTGTAVVQVRVTRKSGMLPQTRGVSTSVSGEAVAVNLGPRGVLFALLKDIERPFKPIRMWRSSPDEIVQSAFPRADDDKSDEGLPRSLERYARAGETRELQPEQLPLLVRFRDMSDSRTVERVDPNALEASFGPGVRLTRATIETVPVGMLSYLPFGWAGPQWLTGVPVTRHMLRQKLPWLSSIPEHYLIEASGRTGEPYLNFTTHGDFIKEYHTG
ncbi:hypothetical protein LJR009_005568 [Bosea sp. LjRoot9]|uniref:hypothetical protein n=1 Tax=Bosea sp. LjRoot9 TaxID=3342341 RepID=UPI003ECCFE17